MKVSIKERKLAGGIRGLYLEYYEKGFRLRESLHLYLLSEDTAKARRQNRETYNRAREIQADRILNPPGFSNKEEGTGGKNEESGETVTWLDWCDRYVELAKSCGQCDKMIQHKKVVKKRIAEYLEKRKTSGILLKDVGKKEICGLFDYMRNEYRNPRQIKTDGGKLAQYTLVLFEETVRAMFNKALRDEMVAFNPVSSLNALEQFHAPDKTREFLTPEELMRFLSVETASENERMVQLAFGLSAMTGLRLGDMQHLRWCDIQPINGVLTIKIVQRKTRRPVSIPLNDMALALLPAREEDTPDDARIFRLVKKSDNVAKYVRRIAAKAGIEKDFTYHSSRHTTATLAISAGADISTVKELLGHSSITSTEVYAKVNLDTKIEAVCLTNGLFR